MQAIHLGRKLKFWQQYINSGNGSSEGILSTEDYAGATFARLSRTFHPLSQSVRRPSKGGHVHGPDIFRLMHLKAGGYKMSRG